MWTGVWVKDILKHIGIKSFDEGAKHVCFVGADKLPNGYYGTSIRREVLKQARNRHEPANSYLVCFSLVCGGRR